MDTTEKRVRYVAAFAFSTLAGCAGYDPDQGPVLEEVATESSPLVGGTDSPLRPEIGWFSQAVIGGKANCTATVIHSSYVITAAHCIDGKTRPVWNKFVMTADDNTASPSAIIDFTFALGTTESDAITTLGSEDVALARLATPLPAGVTPAQFAPSPPSSDALGTVWGYGCNEIIRPPTQEFSEPKLPTLVGAGKKRFVQGQLFEGCHTNTCGGDSGGPLMTGAFNDSAGKIVGVMSGARWETLCWDSIDVYGDAIGRGVPGLAAVRDFGHSTESNRGNQEMRNFTTYARTAGAKLVPGDFNKDGIGDVALSGGVNWQTIPVAFGKSFGEFKVENRQVGSFPGLATESGAKILSGDFNCDNFTDIAVTGHAGWGTIPLALSNGDGTFTYKNPTVTGETQWPRTWAAESNVQAVVGDFDGEGCRDDIALVGHPGWRTIPVAFSRMIGTSTTATGTFNATNLAPMNTDFNVWAAESNVKAVAGRFDNNFGDDIALTGHAGWGSIPVASSRNGGAFAVTNQLVSLFPQWASMSNVKAVVGDFNADNKDDIAITGHADWWTIPFALGTGGGNFIPANMPFGNAPAWSRQQGVQVAAVNADTIQGADLVMVGGPDWGTMPTVFMRNSSLYTYCAMEGQSCSFTGTREVRFGAEGSYVYRRIANGTTCADATFGDGMNVNGVCATGLSGFTYCAEEDGTCSFTGGTRLVAYGANENFSYRWANGSIQCSNGVFGDPVGVRKACYVR